MSVTLSDLRTRIQANWPSNFHSAVLTDAKLTELINKMQRFICTRANFSFMETTAYASTVDGTRTIALPTAAGTAVWTEVDAGTLLGYKDEICAELLDHDSNRLPLVRSYKGKIEGMADLSESTEAAIPEFYATHKGQIWLYPLPDHGLNDDEAFNLYLSYYGYLADLSADADYNELTDTYPEIIEYGVTAMGFRIAQDRESYQQWWNDALEELAAAIVADKERQHGTIEEGMQPVDGNSMAQGHSESDVKIITDYYT